MKLKVSLTLALIALSASNVFAQEANLKTPNISANALFLYRNSNFAKDPAATERNGIDLQEAELAFYADVDPYSRLSMLLAIHPEYTFDATANKVEQEWVIEPEELFAESNHVKNLTMKIGKFKAAFGKANLLHTHAQPLTDSPLIKSSLLGGEGLNDLGVSAAYLLPTPWFSEITAQYLRGEGENEQFNSGTPNDAVGVFHYKNLLDLNESLTGEFGVSYAFGHNSLNSDTNLAGADLTFKWRPTSGGRYQSWMLTSEYINRNVKDATAIKEEGKGYSILGQYQFAERWAAILRYENLKVENANAALGLVDGKTQKYSAGLGFNATEFSSYRLEYNQSKVPVSVSDKDEKKIYFQANFTIGAHPSHSY